MTNNGKHTIMLVDDSSTNNLLYQNIFETEGYNVIVCDDAKTALKKLQKSIPGVIILDLMMPDMDGLDFYECIKKEPTTAHIPVIMLTAKVDRESEKRAKAMGVYDYLIKPVGITVITEKIAKILN